MRWATRIQDVFTVGKLLALGLIIVVGLVQICRGKHTYSLVLHAQQRRFSQNNFLYISASPSRAPGYYDALEPSAAFEFRQDPSVGQIALAFLQASFAYSGWNFLNYVTEEVVEPRKYVTHTHTHGRTVFHNSDILHVNTLMMR